MNTKKLNKKQLVFHVIGCLIYLLAQLLIAVHFGF